MLYGSFAFECLGFVFILVAEEETHGTLWESGGEEREERY
jgi:hypothetical protein